MALNTIQQKTLEYLSTGSSQRQSALNELIGDGFFNPSDAEDNSRQAIISFIETQRERGDFCNDGINRFAEAILGEIPETGPTVTRLTVTLDIDVEHSFGDGYGDGVYSKFGELAQKVSQIASMLRNSDEDPQWTIVGVQASDWDYENL